MPDLDLIVRGATVVSVAELQFVDIGIAGGKIVALEPGLKGDAREQIDASGLHIFPGLIDAHVHFNEPGRADWEGFETGSRALAAGGGTTFFDMPLNAHPPTVDAASFDEKLRAARATSLVDFAFWGGLVPGNLDKLEELAARGVIGFKAFMSNSGIDDFACVDDRTLREGMKRAARLKKIVAVHAESEAMTRELTQQKLHTKTAFTFLKCEDGTITLTPIGNTSIRDYLASRPVEAELQAIRRAVELAGETSCALHVVHVSSGEGVALIAGARRAGVNVSCETCPHYLTLTEEDMVTLGAVAKCAPPLRPEAVQEALWRELMAGRVTTVGSDHSPSPPEMKTGANFFKVWGGISGVQHTLPLMITEGHLKRLLSLPLVGRLLTFNVAERFGLRPQKGALTLGGDADLALLDLNAEFPVEREELFYRHKQSPYIGRRLKGRVVRTILRGQTVFKDGKITSKPLGQLLTPATGN